MSDSEDERRARDDQNIPPFRIRHSDMDPKLVKEVVKQLEGTFKECPLEKVVYVKLIEYLKSEPKFKIGDGEWQCFIGFLDVLQHMIYM